MANGKKKSKKGLIIGLVFIGVLLAGSAVVVVIHNAQSASVIKNVTYTVVSETFENVIDVSGYIEAAESQSLTVSSSGTAIAVYVKEGDLVKKGDVLVQLTDSEEEYNLAQEDYEIEQKQVTGSTKEVELMKKKRAMLVDELEEKQVIAMFDGIVAKLDVSVGDYLEAKDSIGTLINRDYLSADMNIVETDVSKLKVGQKVTFTFPAYTKSDIEGELVSWPSVAEISSSGSTVVEAEVRIYDAPAEILPNYSFTGEIAISEPQTVLLVERYAIGHDNKIGAYAEVVQKDNSTTKTPVEIEAYGTNYVKILSGVEEGDVLKAQIENTSGSEVGKEGVMGIVGGGAPGMGGNPNGGGQRNAGGPPAGGR